MKKLLKALGIIFAGTALLPLGCNAKCTIRPHSLTKKNKSFHLRHKKAALEQKTTVSETTPIIKPTKTSLVTDAQKRLALSKQNNEVLDSTERVEYTYMFSQNKLLKVSTKTYSLNYHERPTSHNESVSPIKLSEERNIKQFKVIYKTSNPEQLAFIERDPIRNCTLQRSSVKFDDAVRV